MRYNKIRLKTGAGTEAEAVAEGAAMAAVAAIWQWQRHSEIRNKSNIGLSAEFPRKIAKMRSSTHHTFSVKNSISEVASKLA